MKLEFRLSNRLPDFFTQAKPPLAPLAYEPCIGTQRERRWMKVMLHAGSVQEEEHNHG